MFATNETCILITTQIVGWMPATTSPVHIADQHTSECLYTSYYTILRRFHVLLWSTVALTSHNVLAYTTFNGWERCGRVPDYVPTPTFVILLPWIYINCSEFPWRIGAVNLCCVSGTHFRESPLRACMDIGIHNTREPTDTAMTTTLHHYLIACAKSSYLSFAVILYHQIVSLQVVLRSSTKNYIQNSRRGRASISWGVDNDKRCRKKVGRKEPTCYQCGLWQP